jgi:hypothetical protein
MKEIFKDIKGYDGLYQVSDMGNVYSLISERMMKKSVNQQGYYRVGLYSVDCEMVKYSVHRLVACNFISMVPGKNLVCHKDGNKTNNIVSNLYWGDSQDNWNDTVSQGMSLKGIRHPKNKLSEKQVLEIYNSDMSFRELSILYNVHLSTIGCIKNHRNWSWLTIGGAA